MKLPPKHVQRFLVTTEDPLPEGYLHARVDIGATKPIHATLTPVKEHTPDQVYILQLALQRLANECESLQKEITYLRYRNTPKKSVNLEPYPKL